MFAKKYRLPSATSLKNSLTQSTPLFLMKYSENSLPYNRYGFIVSKKIDKRATVRNQTKRKIRSILEKLHPEITEGYDFLFICKKQFSEEKEHLAKEVESVLTKASLL